MATPHTRGSTPPAIVVEDAAGSTITSPWTAFMSISADDPYARVLDASGGMSPIPRSQFGEEGISWLRSCQAQAGKQAQSGKIGTS